MEYLIAHTDEYRVYFSPAPGGRPVFILAQKSQNTWPDRWYNIAVTRSIGSKIRRIFDDHEIADMKIRAKRILDNSKK